MLPPLDLEAMGRRRCVLGIGSHVAFRRGRDQDVVEMLQVGGEGWGGRVQLG